MNDNNIRQLMEDATDEAYVLGKKYTDKKISDLDIEEKIPQAVEDYCERNFSEWQGALDPNLESQVMAAPANVVGNLKSALSSDNETTNKMLHLVNYGYDTDYDLPSSGGTGASAIGIKTMRNAYVLNTSGTQTSIVKIKLNDIVRTTNNNVVDEWNGISLKNGHIYRITGTYVSGLSTQEHPISISVYKQGTHANYGIPAYSENKFENTFIYDGTPINLAWVVSAGSVYTNYKALVILEDLSESIEYNLRIDENKIDVVGNLVNYQYDNDVFLPSEGSGNKAISVIRHNTNIILNGTSYSGAPTMIKISGDIDRQNNAAVVRTWEGISLEVGKMYKATCKKISGEISDIVGLSIYKENESATIGTGKSINPNKYIRVFTCPSERFNLLIYIRASSTLTNAVFNVTLEEVNDFATFDVVNVEYSGASFNSKRFIACEKYMTISNETNQSRQGATVYDNYLFVAYNTLPMISVYDFINRSHIGNIVFTPVSTYHCNNINFGSEKYDSDDIFPLLYVSQENENEHKCLVFRITVSEDVFSATLVQTITYPIPSDVGMYYPNAFIDTINNFMYLLGYAATGYPDLYSREYRIMGYNLPKLSDGDVTLDPNDAFQNFKVHALPTSAQGGFIRGDNIIQTFGNPSQNEEIYLMQLSLTGERFISKAVLNGIGITVEPESVFEYNGNLYLFMVDRTIWKLYCN